MDSIRLTSTNNVSSVNKDQYKLINLSSTQRTIPYNDIAYYLNLDSRYNQEKQTCTKYRVISTIRNFSSNVLFNVTPDSSSYYSLADFSRNKFLDRNGNNLITDAEDYTYSESLSNLLLEENGWLGALSTSSGMTNTCEFIDMQPNRRLFSFTPRYNDATNEYLYNYEIMLSYPSFNDTGHTLVNGGLLVSSFETMTVGDRELITLYSPIKTNLNIGDLIRLSNTNSNAFDGTYRVVSIGNSNGDYSDFMFTIDLAPDILKNGVYSSDLFLVGITRFNRVYENKDSKYYFRICKKMENVKSYDIYPLAFSNNTFNDRVQQITFNDLADVEGLTDNLNRPLSELYLSIIKTNDDNIFSEIKAGIEVPYPNLGDTYTTQFCDIHRIHDRNDVLLTHQALPHISTGGTISSTEYYVKDTDNYFYLDICEYNELEQIEYSLADVCHRFNTNNRNNCDSFINYNNSACTGIFLYDGNVLTGSAYSCDHIIIDGNPRIEGYYYKPHNKIKIRDFSSYLEQGEDDKPDYAIEIEDGVYMWRDLLDIGFVDEDTPTDYPFINGSHFLYSNIDFKLKRQDPFGDYGLLFNYGFPNEIDGKVLDLENIIEKEINNIC